MHRAVVRLVDSQTSRLLDIADHARIIETRLSGLEGTDNAAAHEDTTRLTERVVHPLDERNGTSTCTWTPLFRFDVGGPSWNHLMRVAGGIERAGAFFATSDAY
jgi:hypothetical protein